MTKAKWATLDLKQQWDVEVALRGPDCKGSDVIKWFTSSVIRGEMRGVRRVGGMINDSLHMVIVPDRIPRLPVKPADVPQFYWWDHRHFFGHVIEAAHCLGLPIWQLQGSKWLACIESGDIRRSVKEFWQVCPEPAFKAHLMACAQDLGYDHMLIEETTDAAGK